MLRIVKETSTGDATSNAVDPVNTVRTTLIVMDQHRDGHVKEPTSSPDWSLKKSAMSAADLAQFCFTYETNKTTNLDAVLRSDTVPISSSSSTCTRESDTLSDVEGHPKTLHSPQLDRAVSERLNAKVSMRKTSRQGRSSQRWLTDNITHESVRLVTGCVPILQGGKILLVSSNRKPEWILPKGGWERDEAIEESAVRETFEEAGVLGVLGPRLSDIQYETRKAKKRRLEQEEIMRKFLKAESEYEKDEELKPSVETTLHSPEDVSIVAAAAQSPDSPAALSQEALTKIRGFSYASKPSDETASNASTLSALYSQVRMTLFPLYVSKVHVTWPENSRLRKAVDIDEAIELLNTRPEFKQALLEVKERGLHLMSGDQMRQP